MAIGGTHPDYDATAQQWSRARDVLAGEDAVKAAGERYLPRLDSQSDEEYAAYKARASFFGATARKLEEYLDLVFRRAPVLAVGTGEGLKSFVADCDMWGLDFLRYARRVVSEVLAVGRVGSLVLWEQAGDLPCRFGKRRISSTGRLSALGRGPCWWKLCCVVRVGSGCLSLKHQILEPLSGFLIIFRR